MTLIFSEGYHKDQSKELSFLLEKTIKRFNASFFKIVNVFCLIFIRMMSDWCRWPLVSFYLFSSSNTELAVLASSPVVGSSRKRTEGSMMSSIPMFVLFLSPPEIPRVSCVPTWRHAHTAPEQHSRGQSVCPDSQLLYWRSTQPGQRWDVLWCVYINLGVGHFGETQFFDEVIDSSLLLPLGHGAGQPQSCGETQVLPHGQGPHDHIVLRGTQEGQRSAV